MTNEEVQEKGDEDGEKDAEGRDYQRYQSQLASNIRQIMGFMRRAHCKIIQ